MNRRNALQRCSEVSATPEGHCNAAGRFRQLPKAITSLQEGFGNSRRPLQLCRKVSGTPEGHCNAAGRFQITLEAIATLQRGFKENIH
ncbi:hypothetical protein [Thermophagus xiamenensis]|uniref:hypothetical protein n=1 Tax=Thermophagus xiamenensis TaxID=385682 RepID=UPI0009433CC9|nr:hypothetical protein [Thermophagus xiamenensis]